MTFGYTKVKRCSCTSTAKCEWHAWCTKVGKTTLKYTIGILFSAIIAFAPMIALGFYYGWESPVAASPFSMLWVFIAITFMGIAFESGWWFNKPKWLNAIINRYKKSHYWDDGSGRPSGPSL